MAAHVGAYRRGTNARTTSARSRTPARRWRWASWGPEGLEPLIRALRDEYCQVCDDAV
jgi:hypothetical protein